MPQGTKKPHTADDLRAYAEELGDLTKQMKISAARVEKEGVDPDQVRFFPQKVEAALARVRSTVITIDRCIEDAKRDRALT